MKMQNERWEEYAKAREEVNVDDGREEKGRMIWEEIVEKKTNENFDGRRKETNMGRDTTRDNEQTGRRIRQGERYPKSKERQDGL